jgi:shikimate dehydrogenase
MRVRQNSVRISGVIGWPVAHSRSPKLHGAWLARYGIKGAYLLVPVPPAELAANLRAMPFEGFVGANLTIPHKETALGLCDVLRPSAIRARAVNTLEFVNGKTIGSNTDGAGFIANLRAHGVDPARGPALILGAGGAARAIGAALQDVGAAVVFCNRSPERAAALATAFPPAIALPWELREVAAKDCALLVNTTSLGMEHQPPLEMSLEFAHNDLAVADIVYVPLEKNLLRDAKARGLVAVEGLGMLLHQAVQGFAAWFGVTPVVDDEIYRIVAADLLPGKLS